MEQDVEDGQVFTFSVHLSNVVDGSSDKTPTAGQTLIIDREKGKIEPSPLLCNGKRRPKSRRAPDPPIKQQDIDTLNNNDSSTLLTNGDLRGYALVNGGIHSEILPKHESYHDGTVQKLGYTNQILPQKDLSFYRSNLSSLSAHEVALNHAVQRNSCAVPGTTPVVPCKKRHNSTPALAFGRRRNSSSSAPVINGKERQTSVSSSPVANGKPANNPPSPTNERQRHPSALERRPAVIGDNGVALYDTPGTPNKLPMIARKTKLSRPQCIAVLVVLCILLLLIIFVPVAWVAGGDDATSVSDGGVVGGNITSTTMLVTVQLTTQRTFNSDTSSPHSGTNAHPSPNRGVTPTSHQPSVAITASGSSVILSTLASLGSTSEYVAMNETSSTTEGPGRNSLPSTSPPVVPSHTEPQVFTQSVTNVQSSTAFSETTTATKESQTTLQSTHSTRTSPVVLTDLSPTNEHTGVTQGDTLGSTPPMGDILSSLVSTNSVSESQPTIGADVSAMPGAVTTPRVDTDATTISRDVTTDNDSINSGVSIATRNVQAAPITSTLDYEHVT